MVTVTVFAVLAVVDDASVVEIEGMANVTVALSTNY